MRTQQISCDLLRNYATEQHVMKKARSPGLLEKATRKYDLKLSRFVKIDVNLVSEIIPINLSLQPECSFLGELFTARTKGMTCRFPTLFMC